MSWEWQVRTTCVRTCRISITFAVATAAISSPSSSRFINVCNYSSCANLRSTEHLQRTFLDTASTTPKIVIESADSITLIKACGLSRLFEYSVRLNPSTIDESSAQSSCLCSCDRLLTRAIEGLIWSAFLAQSNLATT